MPTTRAAVAVTAATEEKFVATAIAFDLGLRTIAPNATIAVQRTKSAATVVAQQSGSVSRSAGNVKIAIAASAQRYERAVPAPVDRGFAARGSAARAISVVHRARGVVTSVVPKGKFVRKVTSVVPRIARAGRHAVRKTDIVAEVSVLI
jgi:hypothetical protein